MTEVPVTDGIGMAPLIVLEGIDGSGKGTQAAQLRDRLIQADMQAELLSFPRYQSTFFGARIGEFLDGQFGALDQLNPFLISLLYAGDRFESKSTLATARNQSEVVVLDRYVSSNVAHQSAKACGEQRQTLQSWIEQVEYEVFGLPRPQLTILLDLPVDVSQDLIRRKQPRSYTGQQTDLQESDVSYLEQVRQVYLDLARKSSDWTIVSVVRDGELRSVDEIGQEIWETVQPVVSVATQ